MQILFPATMISSPENMAKNLTSYFKKYVPGIKTMYIKSYVRGNMYPNDVKRIVASWNSDILGNVRKAIRKFEETETLCKSDAHVLRVAVDGADGVWSPLSEFVFLWPDEKNLAPVPKTVMDWNHVEEFIKHAEHYIVAIGNFVMND